MRHVSVSILVLMVAFSFTMSQTARDFGQIWQKQSDEPLIYTIGDSGAWNGSSDMWDWNWGHVLQDADTFKLYIGGSDGTNFSIGMWHTMDLESGWTEYTGNPVLQRSAIGWDSAHVGGPMVIKDGDIYKMWYTGTAYLPTHGGNKTIGYATSTDGVNWDKHPVPVINPTLFIGDSEYVWLRNPFVIHEADTFKMWMGVSKVDPTYESIHFGYSLDGINWVFTSEEPVLAPKANRWLDIPSVQKIDGQYVMWLAEGGYGAGYGTETIMAKSSDGIHWRRDELYNPVMRRHGTGGFGDTGVGIYDVIATDEGYSALYGGWIANLETHVGLATYNPTIIPAGDVSGTWTKAESPYRVQGEITVPNSETLTIEPGTTVEFLGHHPLNVQGQILAIGSEDEPIRFWVDDTLGFTNMTSTAGFWRGVRFANTPSTNDSSWISYADIRYAKNFAGNAGGHDGRSGGAFYIWGMDKLRIEYTTIIHNWVIGDFDNTDTFGAGISIVNGSPEIMYNLIQSNVARHLVHSTWAHGGGITLMGASTSSIIGNTIRGNRCSDVGGGVAIWGEECNPLLKNNLIVENSALSNTGLLGYGGGVGGGGGCNPTLINNTIANNSAGWGGGGFYLNDGSATFINTIIAGNTWTNANILQSFGHDFATWGNSMVGRTLDFQNSCLEGGADLIMWGYGNTGDPGTVNFIESLSIDPELTSSYTLNSSRSQCIGAGTFSCEIDGITYIASQQDINGHPCPDPAWSNPDMGAIESELAGHRITPAWNWWHWPDSPFVTPGATGTFDEWRVYAPDVLYFNGQYHMWYTGSDDDSLLQIGYATSDDGTTWVKHPTPVLTGGSQLWQDSHVSVPRVVLVDDTLHMWFTSANRAGHATSTDGIEWSQTTDPVMEGEAGTWDSDMVFISDVIYNGTGYTAWYTGMSQDDYAVGYATSSDGIDWTKLADPVLSPSESGWESGFFYGSSVVANGERYYLWYGALNNSERVRIGRATSLDGINWSNTTLDAPEIGYGEPGSWNDKASFAPAVLIDQGRYKIWYCGLKNPESRYTIGYATMEPVDVESQFVKMPQSFMLNQNYPNPFNPMTHIRYSLPENGNIRLVVYDLLGREVVELVNDHRSVGNYETTWYGLDQHGRQVSTGVYFARLEAGRNVDVIKMLFLK